MFLLGTGPAVADVPLDEARATLSNASIIAVMPEAVESVGVLRLAEIEASDSLLRDEFGFWSKARPGEPPDDDIREWLAVSLARAGISTLAYGGSDFIAPVGIGVARANLLEVFSASTSFTPVREALERRTPPASPLWEDRCPGVCAFAADIVEQAGSMGKEVPGRYFVAFIGNRTVLTAGSEDDLAHMVRSIQAGEERIPPRWRSVAEHADLQSPLLVVRRLLPPLEETETGVEPHSQSKELTFAAWISDLDSTVLEVAVSSSLPLREARKYFCTLAFETGAGEECGPEWARENGIFLGETAPLEPEDGHYYLDLLFLFMFGLWVAI